jgi:recombinational DNA repair ATPase RecF
MDAFGVTLARRGSDASVTVLPQIGGKEIESVLSEGEQRVHALALFFAELET